MASFSKISLFIALTFLSSCFYSEGNAPTDTVLVPGTSTDEEELQDPQLSVGYEYNCYKSELGEVRCWGDNSSGQLGYGNTVVIGENETPSSVGVVAVGGTVTHIEAGNYHTCAILEGGTIKCWGNNGFGQLGLGNTTDIGDNETPAATPVINVGGTVTQLALGTLHTCALLSTGAVRCWGWGADGRLGYGNITDIGDNEHPATAGDVSLGETAVQIVAGDAHTCALLSSGSVRCWGDATYGVLGQSSANDLGDNELPSSWPVLNIGAGTITQLTSKNNHTCALYSTGAVRCWGRNTEGRLGYGNTNTIGDDEGPANAGDVNVGGTVAEISAGFYHTCARLTAGTVKCWGSGQGGRRGSNDTAVIGDNELPSTVGTITLGDTATFVGSGGHHTCVLTTAGGVRCFGVAASGALGYGSIFNNGDDETPDTAGDVLLGF